MAQKPPFPQLQLEIKMKVLFSELGEARDREVQLEEEMDFY